MTICECVTSFSVDGINWGEIIGVEEERTLLVHRTSDIRKYVTSKSDKYRMSIKTKVSSAKHFVIAQLKFKKMSNYS